MTLVERLRSWAQNEEMIDQYHLQHGKDCNEAAERIEAALEIYTENASDVEVDWRDIAEGMCEALTGGRE